MQHRSKTAIKKGLENKEEQRNLLCCNKGSSRCSSLQFNSNSPLVTEDIAMDYLAGVLVKIFLYHKNRERSKS
jgi:hypothetical protein